MRYTTYKDKDGNSITYRFKGGRKRRFLEFLRELGDLGSIDLIRERLYKTPHEWDTRLKQDIYCRFCLWVDKGFREISGLEKYLSNFSLETSQSDPSLSQ